MVFALAANHFVILNSSHSVRISFGENLIVGLPPSEHTALLMDNEKAEELANKILQSIKDHKENLTREDMINAK